MIVSIGECMVELARGPDGRFGLAYGGDTFNMAVYLARAGVAVSYATALGDDPYSAGIVAAARGENVGTELIGIVPGRMPGLYLIETSATGERTFHYWRDRSPARELFEGLGAEKLAQAMQVQKLVVFSGITLSLYSPTGLDRFAAALGATRKNGVTVAMDGNFRPRGWGGDLARARGTFERFWRLADIALPTLEDETMLWGDKDPADVIARLAGWGVLETVVKQGADGATFDVRAERAHVPIPARVTAIDTTAAGDSFNAAYLAARLKGETPRAATLAGHRLAGVVVQHRGAIAPRDATAAAFD